MLRDSEEDLLHGWRPKVLFLVSRGLCRNNRNSPHFRRKRCSSSGQLILLVSSEIFIRIDISISITIAISLTVYVY